MRISDWSSDVCSSDLSRPGGTAPVVDGHRAGAARVEGALARSPITARRERRRSAGRPRRCADAGLVRAAVRQARARCAARSDRLAARADRAQSYCRSEEHTSELQSLMRISYAVFCLKQKKGNIQVTIKIP